MYKKHIALSNGYHRGSLMDDDLQLYLIRIIALENIAARRHNYLAKPAISRPYRFISALGNLEGHVREPDTTGNVSRPYGPLRGRQKPRWQAPGVPLLKFLTASTKTTPSFLVPPAATRKSAPLVKRYDFRRIRAQFQWQILLDPLRDSIIRFTYRGWSRNSETLYRSFVFLLVFCSFYSVFHWQN